MGEYNYNFTLHLPFQLRTFHIHINSKGKTAKRILAFSTLEKLNFVCLRSCYKIKRENFVCAVTQCAFNNATIVLYRPSSVPSAKIVKIEKTNDSEAFLQNK